MFNSSGEGLKQCDVCRDVKLATEFVENHISCQTCQLKQHEVKLKKKLKRREAAKKYYERNKGKIATKAKERRQCDHCGRMILKGLLKKHKTTKRCKRLNEKADIRRIGW